MTNTKINHHKVIEHAIGLATVSIDEFRSYWSAMITAYEDEAT